MKAFAQNKFRPNLPYGALQRLSALTHKSTVLAYSHHSQQHFHSKISQNTLYITCIAQNNRQQLAREHCGAFSRLRPWFFHQDLEETKNNSKRESYICQMDRYVTPNEWPCDITGSSMEQWLNGPWCEIVLSRDKKHSSGHRRQYVISGKPPERIDLIKSIFLMFFLMRRVCYIFLAKVKHCLTYMLSCLCCEDQTDPKTCHTLFVLIRRGSCSSGWYMGYRVYL